MTDHKAVTFRYKMRNPVVGQQWPTTGFLIHALCLREFKRSTNPLIQFLLVEPPVTSGACQRRRSRFINASPRLIRLRRAIMTTETIHRSHYHVHHFQKWGYRRRGIQEQKRGPHGTRWHHWSSRLQDRYKMAR